MPELLPYLLAAQGVVGGIDTLFNHEWIARLPYRTSARTEIGIHAFREVNYGCLFIAVAWFGWHGTAAWIIASMLLLEVGVTGYDEWVENRTRVLPQNERMLHLFLTLNYGVITVVLAVYIAEWLDDPTAIRIEPLSSLRILVTVLGLASLAWGLRDAFAWWRLRKETREM